MLLLGFVAAVQVSIAAAQILLGALLLCWVLGMVRDKTRPAAPTFFVALLAYAGITVLSSVFAAAPLESLVDDRQAGALPDRPGGCRPRARPARRRSPT